MGSVTVEVTWLERRQACSRRSPTRRVARSSTVLLERDGRSVGEIERASRHVSGRRDRSTCACSKEAGLVTDDRTGRGVCTASTPSASPGCASTSTGFDKWRRELQGGGRSSDRTEEEVTHDDATTNAITKEIFVEATRRRSSRCSPSESTSGSCRRYAVFESTIVALEGDRIIERLEPTRAAVLGRGARLRSRRTPALHVASGPAGRRGADRGRGHVRGRRRRDARARSCTAAGERSARSGAPAAPTTTTAEHVAGGCDVASLSGLKTLLEHRRAARAGS